MICQTPDCTTISVFKCSYCNQYKCPYHAIGQLPSPAKCLSCKPDMSDDDLMKELNIKEIIRPTKKLKIPFKKDNE